MKPTHGVDGYFEAGDDRSIERENDMSKRHHKSSVSEWIATNHAPNRPYKVERKGRVLPMLYWIGGIAGVMVLLWLTGVA